LIRSDRDKCQDIVDLALDQKRCPFPRNLSCPGHTTRGGTDEHRKALATPREINSLLEAWITRESPGLALLQAPLG